jgi:outer membrane receptor protein involved in Fe transport
MDNNGAIITGTRGATVLLDWKIPKHTIKYIGGYKDNYFSAANDEGTPFNITTDGGYITDYIQGTNELFLESDKGGLADYKTGVYSLYSYNNSLNRTRYGSDAGAWFANVAQYNSLGGNSPGRNLLTDSLNRAYKNTTTIAQNLSNALYGEVNWHVTSPFTITTGLRVTDEDRRSSQGISLADYGDGGALNPVAVNNVQLGGFRSNATTGALLAGNSAQQLALANTVSQKYFSKNYNQLSTAEMAQIANAKTVRAQQIGQLYQNTGAQPYKGVLLNSNLTFSYKVNENYTPYIGWQHGSKAGVAQINGATVNGGISVPVKPEISENFELGVKSLFLNKTLAANLNFYLDNISNFQQSVAYFDPFTTALVNDGTQKYTTGIGNVPRVQAKGIELDFNYSGIPDVNIRFAGAYNDAVYKDFQYSPLPAERGNEVTPYYNLSGYTLPRAPKFTGNLTVDYSRQVFGSGVFHSAVNINATSGQNYDLTLSKYGWIPAHYLADLSIGLGRKDRLFDANFIIKNLFNDKFHTTQSWNSFAPNTDRWIGIQLSSKL